MAGCSKVWFVSGAGVRLRSEPRANSKALAILTFNTPICVFSEKLEWAEVSLDGVGDKGWIPKEFISSERARGFAVYEQMLLAYAKGDDRTAINLTERLLELEDYKSVEKQTELMSKLVKMYTRLGDQKKSAEMKARHAGLKAKEIASPKGSSFDQSLFESWFVVKFQNSSQSENGFYHSPMKAEEILVVISEIESLMEDGEEGTIAHDKAVRGMPGFFKKVYMDTFGYDPEPSYEILKKRLLKSSFLKIALERGSESVVNGVEGSIVSLLPASALNDVTVFSFIMDHCNHGDLGTAWQRLEEKNVRKRTQEFIRCVDSKNLDLSINRFRFLSSIESLTKVVSEKAFDKSKATVLYSHLSEVDRGDQALLDKLMPAGVDIYAYLPKHLQKTKEMRDHAAKWSTCETIVSVNPADRELLLRVVMGLDEECIRKISPALKKEKDFALRFLKRAPYLASEFDRSVQLDSEVLEALLKVSPSGKCVFSRFPAELPIQWKRKFVGSSRVCLELLATSDFTDREIYAIVASGLLSYEILAKLPPAYKADPNITQFLPRHISGADDDNLMVAYTNGPVLLDVAKKWGVVKLADVWAKRYDEHPHFDYYSRWTPAEHLGEDFWNLLIAVSKKRPDSCSDWQKLVDSWALNVVVTKSNSDGSSSQSNPFGFPLYKLNNEFGCSIETSTDPVVH